MPHSQPIPETPERINLFGFRRMPMPNEQEVKEFANLYHERFGIKLPPDEAYELARHYLHMYMIITGWSEHQADEKDESVHGSSG